MNFDKYQKQASKFAVYESRYYPFLGIAEEVGEFVGLAAKLERGTPSRNALVLWTDCGRPL